LLFMSIFGTIAGTSHLISVPIPLHLFRSGYLLRTCPPFLI
jgi:hypothetical protein